MDKEKPSKKSIEPDLPGLRAMENSAKTENGLSAEKPAADVAGVSESLRGLEEKSTDIASSIASKAAGPTGLLARMAASVAQNKTKAAFGGVAGLLVFFAVIFGFGAVAGYTLITIEKDALKYETKVESVAERAAAKSILKHMMCRSLAGNPTAGAASGCFKTGDPEDTSNSQNETAEEKAAADSSANGTSLTEEMDSFDFTSPQVVEDLAKQGISVKTENGKFSGFTDSAGNTITTEDIANNDALFDSFQTALPEFDIGQITSFEPLLTEHDGATWDGVPEDSGTDVNKAVEGDIIQGADAQQIAAAEGENSETEQPSQSATTTQVQDLQQQVGDNGAITDAAEKAIQSGESEEQALSAAEGSVNLGSSVLVSTIASDVCGVKKVADNASSSRSPSIMRLAVRHISLLLSIADQIKRGNIKSSTISSFMNILEGNKSDPTTVNDPSHPGQKITNEPSLPWNRSAAWLRISGKASEVDTNPSASNYTPDVSSSSLPTATAGTHVVSEVDTAVNDVGGQVVCDVENSPFGSIGNFFANAVQIVSSGFDFGASDAAAIGGVTTVQLLLQKVLIPDIVKYFTPVNMFGNEFATQWLGIADMGANIGTNDYFRSLGAMPVSNTSAASQFALASKQTQQNESTQSFAYRTFALSNPDSLVARIVLSLPSSKLTALSNASSYFTGVSQHLFSSFSDVLPASRSSADAINPSQDPTPGIAYGLTQYGDPNVDKYDPVDNELYLNTSVNYNGVSAKRITMLGDPLSYPNPADNTSTTDVLHCFTQGFTNTASETSPDPICGSLGNYDYANLAPTPITDSTGVATSYCDYFANPSSPATNSATPQCMSAIIPQLHDDIGHFSQFIMDAHVMSAYSKAT